MRVDVNICSKDRHTELFGLLVSLRNQTFQDFDIYILDDGSGNPVQNAYFIQHLSNRLKFEGHRVHLIRNDKSQGATKARQRLAEYTIAHGRGEYICRLDDDIILDSDYLEKLVSVIEAGYDLASGVTPPVVNPETPRDTKYVRPVINRVILDDKGKFVMNGDDCGHTYLQDEILPTDHFRSCALYTKKIHEKVKYDDILAPHSFREEQFFSFRAILAGFKLGVHTGAKAWHLMTPSGGERSWNPQEYVQMNQRLLNKRTRQWFEAHGDFINSYHGRFGIKEDPKETRKNIHKNTNLLITTEE